MDDTGNLADLGSRFNESMHRGTRGNIDRRRADVEARIEKNLRCRIGVLLSDIRQENMLACSNPSHDCLSNRSGPDNYDHIRHFNPH
jgi:hypothetical protein